MTTMTVAYAVFFLVSLSLGILMASSQIASPGRSPVELSYSQTMFIRYAAARAGVDPRERSWSSVARSTRRASWSTGP
jgi:hypothetical protein